MTYLEGSDRILCYIVHVRLGGGQVWERVTWRAYLVGRLTDYFSLPKGEQLRGNTPWTEYNLYWVFAVHAGKGVAWLQMPTPPPPLRFRAELLHPEV